jgi:branched-chain amino acid transport system permease protein
VRRARLLHVALMLVAVAALQLGLGAAGRPALLVQLTMAAYATLVALGLCLLMGFAGQISLGQAGFFALGGYGAAWLTTADLAPWKARWPVALLERAGALVLHPDPLGGDALSVHPWGAAALALLATGGLAALVGLPVLRLRGHYLAMATLGLGSIVSAAVIGTEQLGAADGLSGVPPFPLPLGLSVTGGGAGRVANYYLAWGLVALVLLLLLNLVDSRAGRALRAIHGAEEAAAAAGVDTARAKLATFVLAAVLAALAGVLSTHFNGAIGPVEASAMRSVRYVAIVAVGGLSSLWGTLGMSALLTFLSLRGVFGAYDDAVFAAVLIAVMWAAPEGVLRLRWPRLGRGRGQEAAR